MNLSREQQAFDAWLTTQPEPEEECEYSSGDEEYDSECGCQNCENERALDEDFDAYQGWLKD